MMGHNAGTCRQLSDVIVEISEETIFPKQSIKQNILYPLIHIVAHISYLYMRPPLHIYINLMGI